MAIQCCFERYEKKYCLTLSQQRFLLERMMPYMKKDAYGEYTICNIYYDTDDYRLIRASLEKPVYKEKLRVRSYGVPQEDGKVFVELKKKFDGVVYKRRITTGIQNVEPFLSGELPSENFGQLGREIGYFQSFYQTVPKVFIGYDRLRRSAAPHHVRHKFTVARHGRRPSPRRPRRADRAALRRCADGSQDSRRVPAVAQSPALRRPGVPHVVFQIRCLLP